MTPPRLPSRSDALAQAFGVGAAVELHGERRPGAETRVVPQPAQAPHGLDRSLDGGLGLGVARDVAGDRERRAQQQPVAAGEAPELLGHVRQHRVAEPQRAIEHEAQRGRDLRALGGILRVEPRLGRLEVPVADVVPDEPVERLDRGGEVVGVDQPRDLLHRAIEPRQHPAVGGVPRRAAPAATSSALVRIRRPAFQSLFVRPRPSSIMPSAKRTSCVELILSSP